MASQQASEQIPLYVRWTPERSPYAVEMRLDLVAPVIAELAQAEKLEIEIGGMLIGQLPSADSPVLRVDDVAIIGRRFEDGPIYMLDPEQHHQLSEVRDVAQQQKKEPVGFFRSHLRPGPLLPAIADKTLLAGEFPQGDYALLLIQSQEPRTAAFFLAIDGQLSEQPSVRKFFFDDTEFKRLPEISLEQPPRVASGHSPEPHPNENQQIARHHRPIAVASLVVLVILAVFALFSGTLARSLRPDTNKLNLAVTPRADVLQITWDHSAPFVLKAKRALLTIEDGSNRRDLMLGPDELKLGEVDYEHLGRKVSIVLTLDSPGSHLPPQAIDWSQN